MIVSWFVVKQGSSNLILEGRCPAEFSSNLPQHTCLEVSSIASKTLISCFRCVWLGLELNSAGHRPSRTEFGDPCCKGFKILFILYILKSSFYMKRISTSTFFTYFITVMNTHWLVHIQAKYFGLPQSCECRTECQTSYFFRSNDTVINFNLNHILTF